jgi:hypothetical protein
LFVPVSVSVCTVPEAEPPPSTVTVASLSVELTPSRTSAWVTKVPVVDWTESVRFNEVASVVSLAVASKALVPLRVTSRAEVFAVARSRVTVAPSKSELSAVL